MHCPRKASILTACLSFVALLPALAGAAGPASAQAPSERAPIVISASDFRPLPIAIPAFTGEGDAARDATATVRFDLTLSGLFDVLDPKGFLADTGEGVSASSITFRRWVDVGADGLVKVVVRSDGSELTGELHLYEVRAGREVLSHTVRARTGHALGHRVSDEIVRYYTHEPGIFSSRIVAIRKVNDLYQLVALDVDGQNPEVLLSEKDILLLPAWKPDGSEIVLTSYRTGRPELWVYHLADRSFRSLSHRGNSMGGAYSPDGRRIAFCLTEGPNTNIWVMSSDGSAARRLTHDPSIDVAPSWSPDGKKIIFTSDRAGTPQLYIMSAEGTEIRRLTFQGNYNQTPAWSPRGDSVAFTARDERKVFDIFAVSPDTGVISRVTQDQGRTNEDPSWAPNGRLLVFRTDRSGGAQLVISDPKGDRQTVIFSGGNDLMSPVWGPLAK